MYVLGSYASVNDFSFRCPKVNDLYVFKYKYTHTHIYKYIAILPSAIEKFRFETSKSTQRINELKVKFILTTHTKRVIEFVFFLA